MRSAHFRLPLLACSLSFVACVASPQPNYTFGGSPSNVNLSGNEGSNTPGGNTGLDGGYPDGGSTDGGLPTAPCGSDSDGTAAGPPSNLVISELGLVTPGYIGLYNRSSSTVDLSMYTLQGALTGQVSTGSLAATTDGLVPATLSATNGEFAVFEEVDGGTQMVFYVCWGTPMTSALQQQATAATLWESPSECVADPPSGDSLHLRGAGIYSSDWNFGVPTPYGCTE